MSTVVTAGQRGDSTQLESALERVRVPRIGSGQPRVRPDRVRADKAYASWKRGSPAPFSARLTSRVTAGGSALAAARRRISTRSTSASGMRSSVGSTASIGTVLSPPGTTSSSSATKAPCWSQPSLNGCNQRLAASQAHTALTTACPAEAARA
nr:hypothetical protein [Streptomyces sp. SS]